MTALSAARMTQSKNFGMPKRYPMAASTTIYYGGMVMLNASGLAVPAAAGASNRGVVGVALETVTSAASGDYYVLVAECVAKFVGTGTLVQANTGLAVYAVDDQTVQLARGSHCPLAGQILEYVSATSAWVGIGPSYYRLLDLPPVFLKFHFNLADIADGDLITGITPGFVGFIERTFAVPTKAASTASKSADLNWEIGTTDLTGGVIGLTTAGLNAIGKVVAGSAITQSSAEFDADDTLSLEAANTVAFGEGEIDVVAVLRAR